MNFDKAGIKTLDADIRAALEAVAEKHGVVVKAGGGTYDPGAGTFKPRVEFRAADSGQRTWEQYAPMFGLEASDFGRTFRSGGKQYTITGLHPRSPKRPIVVSGVVDGKSFVFAVEAVKMALAQEKVA